MKRDGELPDRALRNPWPSNRPSRQTIRHQHLRRVDALVTAEHAAGHSRSALRPGRRRQDELPLGGRVDRSGVLDRRRSAAQEDRTHRKDVRDAVTQRRRQQFGVASLVAGEIIGPIEREQRDDVGFIGRSLARECGKRRPVPGDDGFLGDRLDAPNGIIFSIRMGGFRRCVDVRIFIRTVAWRASRSERPICRKTRRLRRAAEPDALMFLPPSRVP